MSIGGFLLRPGILGRLRAHFWKVFLLPRDIWSIRDLMIADGARSLRNSHPNPLNRFGKKCFSQADEDGITLEILRRMDCQKGGVFIEFGVGDGLENNTLILAAMGWRGVWVGGEELAFAVDKQEPAQFVYSRAWITLANIASLAREGLAGIQAKNCDVASLDLDGNDLYFVEELLKTGLKPKLFIVEYNAKFPPPVEFTIPYNAEHQWAGDDYFCASLTSFSLLFQRFGYRLVCCNSQTGSNAFFVDQTFAHLFEDVPTDLNLLYAEPRYHVYHQYGHRPSKRLVSQILNRKSTVLD